MQYRNTFIQEIRLWVKHGFFILIASLILGEAVFRLPWVPGLLSYEFDDELGWQLSPGQIGSLFMGSLSYLSKPITINTDGYRNGPLYWNAPMVICLGSSEALGTGVAEDSVWTARLSALLQPGHPGMMVVNAGGPGYGPYHDLIRLKRFMARKKPALAVVRVSLGDRNFYPPSPSELRGLKSKSDRNRIIRSFSRFLPFLVNKIQAQASAISEIFRGSGKSQVYASEAESEEVGSQMWGESA